MDPNYNYINNLVLLGNQNKIIKPKNINTYRSIKLSMNLSILLNCTLSAEFLVISTKIMGICDSCSAGQVAYMSMGTVYF